MCETMFLSRKHHPTHCTEQIRHPLEMSQVFERIEKQFFLHNHTGTTARRGNIGNRK